MPSSFDFISTTDLPALLAINTPDAHETAQSALLELGYKVHSIEAHEEFHLRFSEIRYQVVIIEELFGGTEENVTLRAIQQMPMSERRHCVFLLLSNSLETLNAMQAFQQSVHAIVNYGEVHLLPQLIQKVVADNTLFLSTFREISKRMSPGQTS